MIFQCAHLNQPLEAKTDSHFCFSLIADVFPVVAFLPPKNSACEPEQQNDFHDVELFVLMLANQIKR